MSLPSIRFYLDYEEDLNNVLFRITHLDPAGLSNRIKNKGIDENIVKKVIESNEDERQQIFYKYLKEYYQEHQAEMQEKADSYQEIWNSKQSLFFSIVTKIMGQIPWKFDQYLFLVSSFYSRASWGKSNKLAVWWQRDPKQFYFLNGYELILTHHFEVIDHIYEVKPVSDWHLWALSEISAYFITFYDDDLKKTLWSHVGKPQNFSYPQLLKPIEDLYPKFLKARSYQAYVVESLDYIQSYSEELLKSPINR